MQWPKNSRFYQYQNLHLLGIDFGEKVTGLSHFTPGQDPFPLLGGKIAVQNDHQVIKKIEEFVLDETIDLVVLGVPHFTDGSASLMTQRVLRFYEKLKIQLKIPIHTQDETLSTFEAKERMKSDPRFNFQVDLKKIDEVSASVILEDFLKSPI